MRTLYTILIMVTLSFRTGAAEDVFDKQGIKELAAGVRAYVNSNPRGYANWNWVRGTYYTGLMAMYESTSEQDYLDDCIKWGRSVSWQIKKAKRNRHGSGAYPLICGQIWLGCYCAQRDQSMIQPTIDALEDPEYRNPITAPLNWHYENSGHRFVDGLYAALPTLAMLYAETGDEKYVNWMDACFWDTYGAIYDKKEKLFYRDARWKDKLSKNGKKVLWSRGNGWAFGALTRILKYLPSDHGSYTRYKALFIEMVTSLAKRQQKDGFWRPNLADAREFNMQESTGTGFFTYGIAWGVNNGILDRKSFLPVVIKGWGALVSVVDKQGRVGWCQPPGEGPLAVKEVNSTKYGAGIFLLAASEVYKLSLD